jgi:hypothetical protein
MTEFSGKPNNTSAPFSTEIGIGRMAPDTWITEAVSVFEEVVTDYTLNLRHSPAVNLVPAENLARVGDRYGLTEGGKVTEQRVNDFLDTLRQPDDIGSTFSSGLHATVNDVELVFHRQTADGRKKYKFVVSLNDTETDEYPEGYMILGEKVALNGLLRLPTRERNEPSHYTPHHLLHVGGVIVDPTFNRAKIRRQIRQKLPNDINLNTVSPVPVLIRSNYRS